MKNYRSCPSIIYNSSFFDSEKNSRIYTFYLKERTGTSDNKRSLVRSGKGYLADFEHTGGSTIPSGTKLNWENLCTNEGILSSVVIIGYFLQVLRYLIPFIIIVLGIISFSKVVISNDEKDLGKAVTSLIKSFVASLIIIFIPTIVTAILDYLKITKGIENEENTSFGICTRCLFDPSDDECKE